MFSRWPPLLPRPSFHFGVRHSVETDVKWKKAPWRHCLLVSITHNEQTDTSLPLYFCGSRMLINPRVSRAVMKSCQFLSQSHKMSWSVRFVHTHSECECACYASSRRFEPRWPWELRLLLVLKLFIHSYSIMITITWKKSLSRALSLSTTRKTLSRTETRDKTACPGLDGSKQPIPLCLTLTVLLRSLLTCFQQSLTRLPFHQFWKTNSCGSGPTHNECSLVYLLRTLLTYMAGSFPQTMLSVCPRCR